MIKTLSVLFVLSLFSAACNAISSPVAATIVPTSVPTFTASPTSSESLPPITGPDPSYKVAAFYYAWYGNLKTDGNWGNWKQDGQYSFSPPLDISSDYYPALGAYSSHDPEVVAQHMAWLRQAGVGVIIVSWWGRGTDDYDMPLIMQMAEHYGIKVAFHIEPYVGRTSAGLVDDIEYIYQKYGSWPAFFRSTASTRYSPSNQPKGMFFVWCIEFAVQGCGKQQVQANYYQKAMDEIHSLPESALMIANTLDGSWINNGHVDGLYNYATLHLEQEGGFNWAHSLPTHSLYIPSVMPGNSAKRVGYPADTYVPRNDGKTFDDQWTAALGTGVQPDMVTITSFNEWHEGTMIEPPAVSVANGQGYTYADFSKLPPDGYLTLTHEWIGKYLNTNWPASYHVRIEITTTSDWTTVGTSSGGGWIRSELSSSSPTATQAILDSNGRLGLNQPLDDAKQGKQVEMVWDLQLSGLNPDGDLILEIDRGDLGSTQVTIYNYTGNSPVQVKTFRWSGITTGGNPDHVVIPASLLINAPNP